MSAGGREVAEQRPQQWQCWHVQGATAAGWVVSCRDARLLFTEWKNGFYQHNKLANVYTAFELQRR